MVATGLDILANNGFRELRGKRLAVLCHQASIDANYTHLLEHLRPLHSSKQLAVEVVFGPQHGLRGHTQDNMVEWEGEFDSVSRWKVASLYGASRKPAPGQLKGVDLFLVDMQDVGSRYYTFIWTLALSLEACQEAGVPVLVLDRPNPIGGLEVEGPGADPAYKSFVGLYPMNVRHGLTIGEVAVWLATTYFPKVSLRVERVEGWRREMLFEQTGLPWVPPSPNMPSPNTALVYPGMCLLEGTNLSEGRGTTRPFEIVGHPDLDSDTFAGELNRMGLPGVRFVPWNFEPTFQKHQGKVCGGAFLAVTDRQNFRPVRTAANLLTVAAKTLGDRFAWKQPPYEYEFEKLPIDILAGGPTLRQGIEEGWEDSWWEAFCQPIPCEAERFDSYNES